jgi:hypothetical protein
LTVGRKNWLLDRIRSGIKDGELVTMAEALATTSFLLGKNDIIFLFAHVVTKRGNIKFV